MAGMISRNGKRISGKRINSAIEKAYLLNEGEMPLEDCKLVDEAHASMMTLGDRDDEPLKVSGKGTVNPKGMRGMFDDDEELSVEIRDGMLVFTKGPKDVYWFPIRDHVPNRPKVPVLKFDTTFDINPAQLAKLAKDTEYVIIETGRSRRTGKDTVFAGFHGKEFVGIDLGVPYEGKPSATMLPGDYISGWGKLGTKAKASMSTNYPIQLDGEDGGVRYSYLLAPRIEGDDNGNVVDPMYRELSGAEKEWVASRNEGRRRLPASASVKEADRRRIEEVFGSRQRFFERMDGMMAHGCPSPFDAAYALFSDARRTTPRWVVADYLSRTIGPEYRSYGDEFEVYARLLARDGASMYEERRAPKKTAKKGSAKKSGNAKKGSTRAEGRNRR